MFGNSRRTYRMRTNTGSWVQIRLGALVCPCLYALCCPVYAEPLRWDESPSKDSYQMSKYSQFQKWFSIGTDQDYPSSLKKKCKQIPQHDRRQNLGWRLLNTLTLMTPPTCISQGSDSNPSGGMTILTKYSCFSSGKLLPHAYRVVVHYHRPASKSSG
jgi:hypothetical protein